MRAVKSVESVSRVILDSEVGLYTDVGAHEIFVAGAPRVPSQT